MVLPEADRGVARGPRGLRRLRRASSRRPTGSSGISPASSAGRARPPATRRCGRPHEGLPPVEYFEAAYPGVRRARARSSATRSSPLGTRAGTLRPEVAQRVGLSESVAVAVGNVDSWVSVPGVGVQEPGTLRDRHRDVDLRHDRPPRGDPAARHHRRRQGRHPARGCTATRRGRRRSATCSPGSSKRWSPIQGVTRRWKQRRRGSSRARPGWSHSTGGTATGRSSPTPISAARSSGSRCRRTREEIYRALLESIAFGSRRIMDNFEEHGLELTRDRRVRRDRRAQPADDAAARRHQRPRGARARRRAEIPARGAALFGAVAAGRFADIDGGDRGHAPESASAPTSPTWTPSGSTTRCTRSTATPVRDCSAAPRSGCCTGSSASARREERVLSELPRIGLLGIMQELYDDMLPGDHRAPGRVRGARRPAAGRRGAR